MLAGREAERAALGADGTAPGKMASCTASGGQTIPSRQLRRHSWDSLPATRTSEVEGRLPNRFCNIMAINLEVNFHTMHKNYKM